MIKTRLELKDELNDLLYTNYNWGRLALLDLERLTSAIKVRLK